jgi:hypothetical protein
MLLCSDVSNNKEVKMLERRAEYVKMLTCALYDVQKIRVMIDNRIDAFVRGGDDISEGLADDLKSRLSELANRMERNIAQDVGKAVATIPVMCWLEKVKGIGPRFSGSLVGILAPITRFENVSKLLTYCGQSVIPVCNECGRLAFGVQEKAKFLNRQAERRWEIHQLRESEEVADEEEFMRTAYTDSEKKLCQCDSSDVQWVAPTRKWFKGLLMNYNPFMKMTCWKISGQFVKQGKFYRTIYEQKKEYYTARDGDTISKGHIENRARRAVINLFLSHLWEMWRISEGLPAGEIYLQHRLGEEFAKHHTLIKPPHCDIYESEKK